MPTVEEINAVLPAMAVPNGHRYTLVLISLVKRTLAEEIPSSYRIQFLDHIEKLIDGVITPEVVAAVEPVCDKGYEMILEAQKLGPSKALDAYAKFFPAFAALNPSLISSLDMAPWRQNWKAREGVPA